MKTIRSKLLTAIGILGASLLATSAAGWVSLKVAEAKITTIVNDRVIPMEQLKVVADRYAVNIVDTAWKARTGQIGWDEALHNVKTADADIHRKWSAYAATYMTPEEKALAGAVSQTMARADAQVARLTKILAAQDQQALEAFTNHDMYLAVDPVSSKVSALVELQIRVAREEGEAARRAFLTSITTMLAIGGGAVLAMAFALDTVVRGVTRPLRAMTAAMRRLAEGDDTIEVPAQDRKDETGDMAQAVLVFKQNAQERLRLEAEAEAQRLAAESERTRVEAERAEAAQQLAEVVKALGLGLDRLSRGDLTFRLSSAFAAQYETLRENYNQAVDRLEATMRVILDNADAIGAGSGQISVAADDLSRRTERQAASLEETAAALDQVTTTVRATADGSRHAREAMATVRNETQKSGDVVGRTVSAIDQIRDTSQQIAQILGVIDEIAFQTNLLALNAGVEAARAGEAGKGFAVVASEVRALAQRSADAAKEIKGLMSASAGQVETGVRLVGETGEALKRISAQIAEVTTAVEAIAASTHEQASGLAQINEAVNQMDQVTQQNAAMVEESTAASRSLAEKTGELVELMAQFQLRGRSASNDIAAPPRAQRRMSPPPVSVGATALKLDAAEEGWEAF